MNHLFDILGGLEFRLQFLFQVGKGCEVDMWHHWQESTKCAIHYQAYKLIRQLCQSIQKCYDNWQRARFALIQAYQKHKMLSTFHSAVTQRGEVSFLSASEARCFGFHHGRV